MVLGLIFVVVSFFWATVAVSSIDWFNRNQVGFFYLVPIPAWLKLILSGMLFDFVAYLFHRMAHNLPLIWRLNKVHHGDTKLDASSNLCLSV